MFFLKYPLQIKSEITLKFPSGEMRILKGLSYSFNKSCILVSQAR